MARKPIEGERRDQILSAAMECLAHQGVADLTMDDIAKAAGLSKGTLYLYFDTKEALLVELTHEWASAAMRDFQAQIEARGFTNRFVIDGGAAMLEHRIGPDDRTLGVALQTLCHLWSLATTNADIREAFTHIYHAWNESMLTLGEQYRRPPTCSHFDAGDLHTAIMATFDGLMIRKYLDPNCDVLAAWRLNAALLALGMRASAPDGSPQRVELAQAMERIEQGVPIVDALPLVIYSPPVETTPTDAEVTHVLVADDETTLHLFA